MVNTFGFSFVLEALKEGRSFTRNGWNGRHKIALQIPGELSKMTKPYIYITTECGDIVPWVAAQSDMLEHDWIEA